MIRKKRSDSKCVLKVAPVGFADGWNVGHEEEARVTAGGFGSSIWKEGVVLAYMRKTVEGAGG